MTETTTAAPKTHTVVGLDSVVTGISVATMTTTGDGTPVVQTAFVRARDLRTKSPGDHLARALEVISPVVETIADGEVTPDLVVMMQPTFSRNRPDPTAERRMMAAGILQERLYSKKIPLAEITQLTLVKMLLGPHINNAARQGFDRVEEEIKRLWHPEMPDEGFRPTTVAVAAAGLIALGVPCGMPVTDTVLKTLSAMSLPDGWRGPLRAKAMGQGLSGGQAMPTKEGELV